MQVVEELASWLHADYAAWPVTVQAIELLPVREPLKRRRREHADFRDAFTDNASVQHAWLKWFVMAHARANAQYEVNVWLPSVLGKYNRGRSGSRGQIMLRHKGLPSPRQFPGRYWEDGTHIRADVAGDDWTAEIGVTSARAIVEPLWSYAAKKVIYVPFQDREIGTHWSSFDAPAARM